MIDQLRLVVEKLEMLTVDEQAAIAAQLEEILDEQEWDELTHRPGAKRFHDELRAEAKSAKEGGTLEDIEGDSFA